ncbi:MAG: hypothetical protein HY561_06325 [Gemmatimonadetes bacterium]|nr:hypothetical protein [Gemmatimonadota bacterium]
MTDHRAAELGRHPRGTLAIVLAYGLVFALGWLVLYFLVYSPRGAIHP